MKCEIWHTDRLSPARYHKTVVRIAGESDDSYERQAHIEAYTLAMMHAQKPCVIVHNVFDYGEGDFMVKVIR